MLTRTLMPRGRDTSAHVPVVALDLDPARDDLPPDEELQRLLGGLLDGELLRPAPPTSRRADDPGETPVEGAGAVARWVALHDRARDLRSDLCPGDSVGARQVRRAVRSLFLYEHQLTAKTRRRARTVLWQRDQRRALPAFVERVRWAKCRCWVCQPAVWTAAPASALLRTA